MIICIFLGYFFVAYIMHSFVEWGFHIWMDKYEPKHKNHHKSEDEGLYVNVTGKKTVLGFVIPSLLLMLVYNLIFPRLNMIIPISIHLIIMLYSITTWNTLHGYMHGKDCSKESFWVTSGLCLGNNTTNTLLNTFPYLNFIIENHTTHHETGSSNYTMVLPFADFIMGTYQKLSKD